MKQTILLNWPYHRKDWLLPFLKLQDQFEFIFLSYPVKPSSINLDGFKTIYWQDYSNANEILNSIQPDKVVFMSIESGYAIALNMAARTKSIPTMVLQHGLFHDYEFYRKQEIYNRRSSKYKIHEDLFPSDKKHIFKFLIRSLSTLQIVHLPLIFFYLTLKNRLGTNYALKLFNLNWRKSQKYICYTMFNARIYKERDRITEHKLVEIGNPHYDQFFQTKENFPVYTDKYYLLIDQPFAENSFNEFDISKSEMNAFYSKLNEFCISKNAKLYIKLHPESYNSTFMLQHENIKYFKDIQLEPLIRSSEGCFGSFSNILLPALLIKKCILFKSISSKTQDDIVDMGMADLLDFKGFSINQIDFSHVKDNSNEDEFVRKYFYLNDGMSIERLSKILAN